MKAAIYNGIFASSDQYLHPLPVCSTGNCTFDPFDTLAICSACLDVSHQTTLASNTMSLSNWSDWTNEYVNNYTYTLPGDFNITATAIWLDSEKSSLLAAQAMVAEIATPNTMSRTILNVTNPLVAFGILQFPEVEAEGYQGSYDNQSPKAWECALAFCLQTYNVSVQNNNVTNTLLSTFIPPNGTPVSDSLEDTVDGIFHRPANEGHPAGSNDTFFVPGATIAGLAQYFNHTLQGYMPTSTTEVPTYTYVDDLMQALNITTNIGFMMQNLATSMTTWIRTMGNSPQPDAFGTVLHLQILVQVRWAWLSLLVLLEVGTAVLLACTIGRTMRHGNVVWKQSSLATLFHGLDDTNEHVGSGAMGIKEMEDAAKSMTVSLGQGRDGRLKLGGQTQVHES